MPLEPSVTWFSDFTTNWPLDGDLLVEGDNHIRNIKGAIVQQLPNLGNVQMTATATELNVLDGAVVTTADLTKLGNVTANATELNVLDGILASTAELNVLQGITGLASNGVDLDNFPSGTLMTFQQQTTPNGWTRQSTHNNKALRVVNGVTWGPSGGTAAFTSVFGAGKNTGAYTLQEADIPGHTHSVSGTAASAGAHTHPFTAVLQSGANRIRDDFQFLNYNSVASNTGSAGAHTHSVSGTAASTGGGGSHSHTLSLDLEYVDIIIGQKD